MANKKCNAALDVLESPARGTCKIQIGNSNLARLIHDLFATKRTSGIHRTRWKRSPAMVLDCASAEICFRFVGLPLLYIYDQRGQPHRFSAA